MTHGTAGRQPTYAMTRTGAKMITSIRASHDQAPTARDQGRAQ
jgi:hypothetical protein